MYEPLHKYSLEMNETRFKTVKLLPQHKHQQAQAEGELISSRIPADHVSGRNYGALSHAFTGATCHKLLHDLEEAEEEVGGEGRVGLVFHYDSDEMDEGEVMEEDEQLSFLRPEPLDLTMCRMKLGCLNQRHLGFCSR